MANKFTTNDINTGSGRLARHLTETITRALDARSGLKVRWTQNEAVYRNEPGLASVRLFENLEPRTVPILSPRVNRIVNMTIGAVTSSSPWVRAVPEDGDQEAAGAIERGMQTVMERARFDRVLRRSLTTAALCGVSIVRVRMTAKGLKVDTIHPNDFIVAPTQIQELGEASLVGHRYYLPYSRIEEKKRSGAYPLLGSAVSRLNSSDPDGDPSGRNPDYDKSLSSDGLIELFEVVALLDIDGQTRRYRIVIAPSAEAILVVEPYPYDRPWYFDLRLHDEQGKWWPASSIAQNVVGLCMLQNDLFNLMVAGSMASVANPVVVSGGSLGKKLKSMNLGQLFETPYDVRVQEIPMSFDAGAMPGIMDIIDNQIDAQTGVTQLAIGQEFLQSQTATAAKALIESSKQNEASYSMYVSDTIEDVWTFVTRLVRTHPKAFRAAYGASVPDDFTAACCQNFRWQASGRLGAATPTLVQKLQALLELATKEQSGYSYARVEDALVSAMQLPVSTDRLRKSDNE